MKVEIIKRNNDPSKIRFPCVGLSDEGDVVILHLRMMVSPYAKRANENPRFGEKAIGILTASPFTLTLRFRLFWGSRND